MNRQGILAVAVALMIALSGCAFLTGGPLEFAASKATIADQAQQDAGYEEVSVESRNQTRTVSAAGQEREVHVTNWIATYERDLGITTSPAPGRVAVLSTPTISVAGQSLNPIASMSDRQILETVLQQYGEVGNVQEQGNRTVTMLESDETVTTFSATVDYEGHDVPVLVHLTTVEHEGDVVVGIAIHPRLLSAEQAGVDTMFRGIEHDGD